MAKTIHVHDGSLSERDHGKGVSAFVRLYSLESSIQSQNIIGGLHDDLLVGQLDNPYRSIHYRTVDEVAGKRFFCMFALVYCPNAPSKVVSVDRTQASLCDATLSCRACSCV